MKKIQLTSLCVSLCIGSGLYFAFSTKTPLSVLVMISVVSSAIAYLVCSKVMTIIDIRMRYRESLFETPTVRVSRQRYRQHSNESTSNVDILNADTRPNDNAPKKNKARHTQEKEPDLKKSSHPSNIIEALHRLNLPQKEHYTRTEIKQAYHRLARHVHPDSNSYTSTQEESAAESIKTLVNTQKLLIKYFAREQS